MADFVFACELPLYVIQLPDRSLYWFECEHGEKFLGLWSDWDAAESFLGQCGVAAEVVDLLDDACLTAAFKVARLFGCVAVAIDPTRTCMPAGWRRLEFDDFFREADESEIGPLMVEPSDFLEDP